MVVASGDNGAHGSDKFCASDALLTNSIYPASSPYVLTVGATQIKPGSAKYYQQTPICRNILNSLIPCAYPGTGVEIAASSKTQCAITSGGGFATFESVSSMSVWSVDRTLIQHQYDSTFFRVVTD